MWPSRARRKPCSRGIHRGTGLETPPLQKMQSRAEHTGLSGGQGKAGARRGSWRQRDCRSGGIWGKPARWGVPCVPVRLSRRRSTPCCGHADASDPGDTGAPADGRCAEGRGAEADQRAAGRAAGTRFVGTIDENVLAAADDRTPTAAAMKPLGLFLRRRCPLRRRARSSSVRGRRSCRSSRVASCWGPLPAAISNEPGRVRASSIATMRRDERYE